MRTDRQKSAGAGSCSLCYDGFSVWANLPRHRNRHHEKWQVEEDYFDVHQPLEWDFDASANLKEDLAKAIWDVGIVNHIYSLCCSQILWCSLVERPACCHKNLGTEKIAGERSSTQKNGAGVKSALQGCSPQ